MKNKQKGFFGKIFGGSKKDNCCAIEIEEIPEEESEVETKKNEKQDPEQQSPKSGCGCCG